LAMAEAALPKTAAQLLVSMVEMADSSSPGGQSK
jgi:hypothetical protein